MNDRAGQRSTRLSKLDLDLDDLVEPLVASSPDQEDPNLIDLPEIGTEPCDRLPKTAASGESGAEHGTHLPGLTLEWLTRGDRLSATITRLTGWRVSIEPDGDRPFGFPVFSDGEKTYRFDEWKILISFRHMPGIALLGWSPESLEDDLKKAEQIRPESLNVQRVAHHLLEHLSTSQIEELLAALTAHRR